MVRYPFSAHVVVLLFVSILLPTGSHAVPLFGVLNTTGSARVTASTLDFLPLGGGEGDFAIDAFTQQGFFVTLAGTTGDIGDLNQGAHPVGSSFSFPLWMTFDANPAISFRLEFIHPGVFSSAQCGAAPAAGQTCTPFAGSPFNLSNTTADSSVASFQVSGTSFGTAGEPLPFTGTFSTQYTNMSFQEVLAQLSSAGFVEATYSANFVIIPEPGSASLLVASAALFGLSALLRKARRR